MSTAAEATIGRESDMAGELLSFGQLIRQWRAARRVSQLQLALKARVSARHISFLEVGRARPSGAMVETLSAALDLSPEDRDALRTAAGFAVRYRPLLLRSDGGRVLLESDLATSVLQTALSFETALTTESLVAAAKPMLSLLGMRHFFTFTIPGPGGVSQVEIDGPAAFPERWLSRYQAKRYSTIDPLVQHVRQQNTGFFWDEVAAVRRPGPARQIFDEGKRVGLTMGYITLLREADGKARVISMLGDGIATTDRRVRFALQTLGVGLLDRYARLSVRTDAN